MRASLILHLCLSVFICGGISFAAMADDVIWWEAEKPVRSNFPARSDFAAKTLAKRDLLSAGDWLTASGVRTEDELFAQYRLVLPEDGEYRLWVRKFWRHGPFQWRIGDDEWQYCGKDAALADETALAPNLSVNWVCAGRANLKHGETTVEIRLLADRGDPITAGFDCFVLTRKTFMPNGGLKPGETSGVVEEGCFAFEPPMDSFTKSPIDLRYLNETVAGQSGFLCKDGTQFVLGDGSPVRFWAVNIGINNILQDHDAIDYMARKLAKLGVNMVRFHSPLFEGSGDVLKLNPRYLDALHYTVAAMKRQGIYTKLSFYFPVWLKVDEAFGLDGYDGFENRQPFGLLYFNGRMQEIYKSWAKELLTTVNPYTQLELARDPTVGIVEIINEDSFFFWTFNKKKVPAAQWRQLEEQFSTWAITRYGSVDRALDAWDGEDLPDDSARDGHLSLYEAPHMTGKMFDSAGKGKRNRIGDQVQFLAGLQHGFYSEMSRYFKEDLGYGGLVSASNWVTADARLLGAIERWTYTAGDVIDRHGYFEPKHEGDGAAWSVRAGHTFTSRPGVQNPERLPLQFQQVEGYPQIISELSWSNPNRFRADATFLCSAYGSLQGIDGLFLFALDSDFVRDSSMFKFAISSPVISATFPAASLQYRRGDVVEAEPVVVQSLDLRDLFAMKGTASATADALDEFRKKDIPAGGMASGPISSFDPLTYFVGPFVQNYSARPDQSKQVDVSSFIDRAAKMIRSRTGELVWDFGKGVARINTSRSQGAAGFLSAAGRIELGDVVIQSGNEYASIMVISLDDLPLSESKRILVQAMTEEKPSGFKTEGDRIIDLGSFPFIVRDIDATITLKNTDGVTLQALDANGYLVTERTEDGDDMRLEPASIYHVILRQ
jgi:hypothetical protein